MAWISGNFYLGQTQMENNALEVWRCLSGYGCTVNGVAAILGNMQAESTINPGIWEGLTPSSTPGAIVGYGLCQWTPWNKYADWAGAGWQDNGDKECERIIYESQNGIQWFENYAAPQIGLPVFPPITLWEMLTSTDDCRTLASYFHAYYEHPAESQLVSTDPTRKANAAYWYEYLYGTPPGPGPGPGPSGRLPIWLIFKLKERYQ